MAKYKKTHELTTTQALRKLFGEEGAKTIREALKAEDALKVRKHRKRKGKT